jgi:hypothetical protein
MYPRIPWELVAYPLESAEHILGTTSLRVLRMRIDPRDCGFITGARLSGATNVT